MLYNFFFGFYENVVNKVKNTINNYFVDKPQKSLVENNYFLLLEHVSFFTTGILFFYHENWLWDITQIWTSNLNVYIFIYYYLYITRYVVKAKMLTGGEKDYKSALVHHISTILLLVFSFWRNHRIGIMIGIIHDISDIFLLKAKIFLKYYETFHKEYMKLSSYLFLSFFAISFFFTRIILNSYFILYMLSVEYYPRSSVLDFYHNSIYFKELDSFLCFSLLFLNLAIQMFYQIMIIKFIYKLVIGGNPEDEKCVVYLNNKKK